MARRKPKPDAAQFEDAAPPPERWARREVERLPRAIADEEGRPGRPYRAIDTLAQMERRGTIDAPMRQAAEEFRAAFRAACLDPLRASDLSRAPQGARMLHGSERPAAAREKIWSALTVLGGINSPAGSCVWHVVGCEWTVKEWALRAGWGGRPLSQETAAGVLIGALGALRALYGF